MLSLKIIDDAKVLLVAPALIVGLAVASTTAMAAPRDKSDQVPNERSEQDVDVYEVDWGEPKCSSFSLQPLGGMKIKEISNIVLSCASNDAEEITWSKWDFDEGAPYVFGTELPTDLEPTEGNGCQGLISIAYVKAGSIKTRKGFPDDDSKQFNGHLGGEIACTPIGGN